MWRCWLCWISHDIQTYQNRPMIQRRVLFHVFQQWKLQDALAVSQCNLHELMSGFTQMGMSQQCWLHVLARWARAEPPDLLWKCTLGCWETIATDHDFTIFQVFFICWSFIPMCVSVESQAFLDDNWQQMCHSFFVYPPSPTKTE